MAPNPWQPPLIRYRGFERRSLSRTKENRTCITGPVCDRRFLKPRRHIQDAKQRCQWPIRVGDRTSYSVLNRRSVADYRGDISDSFDRTAVLLVGHRPPKLLLRLSESS